MLHPTVKQCISEFVRAKRDLVLAVGPRVIVDEVLTNLTEPAQEHPAIGKPGFLACIASIESNIQENREEAEEYIMELLNLN